MQLMVLETVVVAACRRGLSRHVSSASRLFKKIEQDKGKCSCKCMAWMFSPRFHARVGHVF